jgi:hypothetical protein
MEKKLLAVIVFIVIASLSIAGCTTNTSTPTTTTQPTTTAQADYSSYFDKAYQAGNFFLDKPFTKSTNIRGNDVYMGSIRNTSISGAKGVTVVDELTKSQAEAKQLYDKYVSDKLSQGYTSYPQVVANWKTQGGLEAVWFGATDSYYTNQFYVWYQYNDNVNSWDVTTQAKNA